MVNLVEIQHVLRAISIGDQQRVLVDLVESGTRREEMGSAVGMVLSGDAFRLHTGSVFDLTESRQGVGANAP